MSKNNLFSVMLLAALSVNVALGMCNTYTGSVSFSGAVSSARASLVVNEYMDDKAFVGKTETISERIWDMLSRAELNQRLI